MAQSLRVVREESPAQKLSRHLSELDDDKLACKAGRHPFQPLHPGDLAGVKVTRAAGGCYQLTEVCPNCGLPRTVTTLKGGVLDPSAKYDYDYTKVPGYLAPAGAGATKRIYKEELGDRLAPAIRKAATGRAPRAVS